MRSIAPSAPSAPAEGRAARSLRAAPPGARSSAHTTIALAPRVRRHLGEGHRLQVQAAGRIERDRRMRRPRSRLRRATRHAGLTRPALRAVRGPLGAMLWEVAVSSVGSARADTASHASHCDHDDERDQEGHDQEQRRRDRAHRRGDAHGHDARADQLAAQLHGSRARMWWPSRSTSAPGAWSGAPSGRAVPPPPCRRRRRSQRPAAPGESAASSSNTLPCPRSVR